MSPYGANFLHSARRHDVGVYEERPLIRRAQQRDKLVKKRVLACGERQAGRALQRGLVELDQQVPHPSQFAA